MENSYRIEKEPISKPIINVGSTILSRFGVFLLLGLVVFSLAGCKELADAIKNNATDNMEITPSNNHYVAFAAGRVESYNPPYLHLTWGRGDGSTRSEAESNAIYYCEDEPDVECEIELSFTNQCGAFSTGTGRFSALIDGKRIEIVREAIVGTGTGDTRSAAETNAIEDCRANGGENCRIAVTGAGTSASVCTD